jgi:hypothetical protein
MLNKEIKKEDLEKQVIQVFERFNWRDDVEEGLRELGFKEFFGDPDEKIYFTPSRKHDILVYVNWIDGVYWIYQRTFNQSIL